MMLAQGETVVTESGRTTTPFPKVDVSTERKTKATLKRVEAWLLENAIAEAKARGDEFNLLQFEGETAGKLPPATKEGIHLYLFGCVSP